ncbi:MAG TPA: hypothetical protein VLX64_01990, partial [Thermoplasmata archaeon]|nr:hypothetical protein [Thermoplasmata archaeon]
RQVDNEAESPGYTTIPDDFPGLRDTLESIRIVGNLTINIADTHDYWDPGPSQSLSFYPNLFLYPAAGHRYTCVGRMFLSTEDRPRLGMKTLVFSTAELLASGDFGGMVRRAHATMDGRGEIRRLAADPDPAVYQAVGDGFFFGKGTTDPVVVLASDQWEAAAQAVLELVGAMPAALVALGAFLVFPYFLPAPKVNLSEFSEQLPTALAVMRVARGEAAGDRHEKRIKSWEELSVSFRDLTRPAPAKKPDALPLTLQYVREHQDEKLREIARRVDAVELPRLGGHLTDASQMGRDRRKEMWRIGAAMETAALLLSKPKGRSVSVTGEAAKRANEYLQARPPESESPAPVPIAPAAAAPVGPGGGTPAVAAQHPAWLRPPPQISVGASDATGVPVPTSDDPSMLPPGTAPTVPPPPPVADSGPRPASSRLGETGPVAVVAPAVDLAAIDARVQAALKEQEGKWAIALEARIHDAEAHLTQTASEAQAALDSARAELAARLVALEAARTELAPRLAALETSGAELTPRLAALEARPTVDPTQIEQEVDARVAAAVDERASALAAAAAKSAGEAWTTRFTTELKRAIEEFDARAAKSEEELRAALVAQLDVELSESKEQGTALREEIEARVRKIIDERGAENAQRVAREVHDVEQRLSLLIEGRAKDLETKLGGPMAGQKEKLAALADERVARVEQRVALEREARLSEITEAQTEALAGLQVRMQSFVEGKLREGFDKEREQTVALLARMKLDTEQSLARTVDAAHLDTLLNERLTELMERAHSDQSKAVAAAVTHSEARIRAAQQELLARVHHLESTAPTQPIDVGLVERTVRRELDDFDRRLKVVYDHILPMVRQTWLKVSAQESGGSLRDLRQSLETEIQKVEASLVAQNDQLRERLETAVAQHGRIWLNLLQQLSRGEATLAVEPPAARGRSRAGVHRAARPVAVPPPAPVSDGSFPPEATAPYGRPTTAEAHGPPETVDPNERRRLRRPAP